MPPKNHKKDDARKTSCALELAIAQIEMSLQESDQSIGELIQSMTAVTQCMGSIKKRLATTADFSETAHLQNSIHADCNRAEQYMQDAVITFQFYDRLSQRISHIQENLRAVSTLIQKPKQQHPLLWDQLQEKMRSVYSIEQEQIMYNTLMQSLAKDSAAEDPVTNGSVAEDTSPATDDHPNNHPNNHKTVASISPLSGTVELF